MRSSKTKLLTLTLGLTATGLILSGYTFAAIVAAFLGLGIWMADFRWTADTDSTSRLVAKGSPALLMIALVFGAAKVYVVTADALVPALSAQLLACPTDGDVARLILLRALEALH